MTTPLDLFEDEATVSKKVKLRAYAITVDNTYGRPPRMIYHQERVFLENDERTGAERGTDMQVPTQEALTASYELANGAIVSGADVAEWFMRDYVARKKAEKGGKK